MIDIAIIGGGPAGLAAGLYAVRGGMDCVLFEEMFPGGQITKTERIENYPGFVEGIEGMQLGTNLFEQAARFGLKLEYTTVEKLELDGPVKKIHTSQGVFEAKRVILAMGAKPKSLGLPEEKKYLGLGISYCATCDGALFKGRPVAVVGGGDTAVSDALYLSRFAEKVYLIHRRDELRANHTLQQALFANKNVEVLWNTNIKGYVGEKTLAGLELINSATGEERMLTVAGLFMAVGIDPRSDLVKDILALEDGYIVTDDHMKTGIDGVYAAGDVRKTPLRQVVTAVADGAVAATMAIESLF